MNTVFSTLTFTLIERNDCTIFPQVTSSVLANMTIPLGQQHHLGGPISAPGVAVAQPITPSQSSAEEDDEEEEGEEVKAKGT